MTAPSLAFSAIAPESNIYKEIEVTKSILGVPVEYKDRVRNYLNVDSPNYAISLEEVEDNIGSHESVQFII